MPRFCVEHNLNTYFSFYKLRINKKGRKMSSDVRDILEIERPPTPELTKESLLNKHRKPINEL